MKAIVTGMIATSPLGGVAWDYGQYVLGLERLGFDVYYLEDSGEPSWTRSSETGEWEADPTLGLEFLEQTLALLSPSLRGRWHYRDWEGRRFGLELSEVEELADEADLLLNVSGGCVMREEYRRCRRKVLIDTDPGWNHFVVWPFWDEKPATGRLQGFRAHDRFFTYATRLGRPDCPLPDFGLDWQPTRPPVVLDCWRPREPAARWTTVMNWSGFESHPVSLKREGREGKPDPDGRPRAEAVPIGGKEVEFARFEALPRHLQAALEVQVNADGDAPLHRWRELGWSVEDAEAISRTAESYRSYIEASRGELSVAKQSYVSTRCGWFSCRSVCYLAAGRPVVVQDTGFSDDVPTGQGLLAFSSLADAVRAVSTVEADYTSHAAAARQLAAERFEAGVVLPDLLARAGVG